MSAYPTLSFVKPAAEARVCVLPVGVSVRRVTEASRRAGLAFLSGSALGWDRANLRSWFVLDYEPTIAWSRPATDRIHGDPAEGLDDVDVSMLVDQIRERTIAMLHGASVNWRSTTFARDMINAGLAVVVYDRVAVAQAYAPAVHGDMRLKDRVTSLFVADFLSNPSDYDRLGHCDACGDVAIGAMPRHPAWCARPPTKSGVIERRRNTHAYGRRSTLKGVG
jgi:hypothetical protein